MRFYCSKNFINIVKKNLKIIVKNIKCSLLTKIIINYIITKPILMLNIFGYVISRRGIINGAVR